MSQKIVLNSHLFCYKYSFTKISACLFWNQLYADSDNWDEKVGYLKKVLDSCTIDEWNNHYGSIGTLLYTVTNDANGKKTCIDLLTKILEQEKQLDDSVVLAIRNDLAVIYGANSSYAKAIEQSLYTISKAEEMGNNYFQAKAKTDMSTIYDTLGDYDTARKLAEESSNAVKHTSELIEKSIKAVQEGKTALCMI